MDTVFIASLFVSIFSLALTVIGLPAQIIKNYREKRSGQPLLTVAIALGFYASQIWLFAITGAWLPFISFVIGFCMWWTIFAQYFLYRKHSGV